MQSVFCVIHNMFCGNFEKCILYAYLYIYMYGIHVRVQPYNVQDLTFIRNMEKINKMRMTWITTKQ